jgi:hypothetical protein
MSDEQAFKQIFIGSVVALVGAIAGTVATAIINLLLAGKISVNYWWVWGIGAVLGALLLYGIYPANRFPFKKWRVTNIRDGKGLLFREDLPVLEGKPDGEAWQFVAHDNNWAIYGPYLRQSLRKGKYRAAFRVKVNNVSGEDRHVIELSVASNCKAVGDKQLAARTLTTRDFKSGGVYHIFFLYFDALVDERDLELRIYAKGSGHTVTLDYVRLSRRLF